MSTTAKRVLEQAMELSPFDRAALVEGLVSSLDQPDDSLDRLWLKEAKVRLDAYHSKEITAEDAGQVFSKLGQSI